MKYTLDVGNYAENITLKIIDRILEIEGSKILIKKELKYTELELYILGVRIINSIILQYDSGVPIVDAIIDIDDNVNKNYMTGKNAWEKIKSLMKNAAKFTKKYDTKIDIDLDNIKMEITGHTKTILEGITEGGKDDSLTQYITAEGILKGVRDTYDALLESLNIDIVDNEIPVLESIKSLRIERSEKKISLEEYSKKIRDIITEI